MRAAQEKTASASNSLSVSACCQPMHLRRCSNFSTRSTPVNGIKDPWSERGGSMFAMHGLSRFDARWFRFTAQGARRAMAPTPETSDSSVWMPGHICDVCTCFHFSNQCGARTHIVPMSVFLTYIWLFCDFVFSWLFFSGHAMIEPLSLVLLFLFGLCNWTVAALHWHTCSAHPLVKVLPDRPGLLNEKFKAGLEPGFCHDLFWITWFWCWISFREFNWPTAGLVSGGFATWISQWTKMWISANRSQKNNKPNTQPRCLVLFGFSGCYQTKGGD